jgi:uncharacterized protein
MKSPDVGKYVLISVKVIPNASKTQVVGWEEDRLRVRLQGAPEKGRANQKLLELLADELGIAKTRIAIQSGEKNRLKKIRIEGIGEEDLRRKWK